MRRLIKHIICLVAIMLTALTAMGQQAAMTQITGLVRDSLSHEGIAYASVYWEHHKVKAICHLANVLQFS